MKSLKSIPLVLLLIIVASLGAAQTATRKPAKPAAASAGESKSAPAAAREQELLAPIRPGMVAGIEQQVAMQEIKFKKAALDGDVAYLKKLLAPGFLSTNPDGVVNDRAQAVALLDSGAINCENVTLSDMKVRGYGSNLVVVNARGDLKGRLNDRDISGAYQYTRVWLKQAGSWRIIAFQASRLSESKNPSGIRK